MSGGPSTPPPVASSSVDYKLQFQKNPLEKLEFVQDVPRNETVKKWTADSADTIRAASHGQPWLMNMIFNIHPHRCFSQHEGNDLEEEGNRCHIDFLVVLKRGTDEGRCSVEVD
jgi:hypothetical protein